MTADSHPEPRRANPTLAFQALARRVAGEVGPRIADLLVELALRDALDQQDAAAAGDQQDAAPPAGNGNGAGDVAETRLAPVGTAD